MTRLLWCIALAIVVGSALAEVRHRSRTREELTSETRRRIANEVERIVIEHERAELADRAREGRNKVRLAGSRNGRVPLRDRLGRRLARWLGLGIYGRFEPDRDEEEAEFQAGEDER